MIVFPDIDPVAVQIGPLAVRWYGISYLVGIGLGWWLLARTARSRGDWDGNLVADVVFYAAIGAVLGGRVGYTLFYNLPGFMENPLVLLTVWRGGMSFHGGVLGFIVAMWIFARQHQRGFFEVTDFVIPVVPVGLFFGRIANFVNQELWGATTTLPWGVLFTAEGAGNLPRHPSQLYEAGLEGIALFIVLALIARRRPRTGIVSAAFLVGYAICRIAIEFVREPDLHIGYLAWEWVTMGQLLSLPMIIGGLAIGVWAMRRIPVTSIDASENPHLRDALDIASGAVLLASIGAMTVGGLLLVPAIWQWL